MKSGIEWSMCVVRIIYPIVMGRMRGFGTESEGHGVLCDSLLHRVNEWRCWA